MCHICDTYTNQRSSSPHCLTCVEQSLTSSHKSLCSTTFVRQWGKLLHWFVYCYICDTYICSYMYKETYENCSSHKSRVRSCTKRQICSYTATYVTHIRTNVAVLISLFVQLHSYDSGGNCYTGSYMCHICDTSTNQCSSSPHCHTNKCSSTCVTYVAVKSRYMCYRVAKTHRIP